MNEFADLIPQNKQNQARPVNEFADLIPKQNMEASQQNEFSDLIPKKPGPVKQFMGNLGREAVQFGKEITDPVGLADAGMKTASDMLMFIPSAFAQGAEAIAPNKLKGLSESIPSYTPFTQTGQKLTDRVSSAMQLFRDAGGKISDTVGEAAGKHPQIARELYRVITGGTGGNYETDEQIRARLATVAGTPIAAIPEIAMLLGIGKGKSPGLKPYEKVGRTDVAREVPFEELNLVPPKRIEGDLRGSEVPKMVSPQAEVPVLPKGAQEIVGLRGEKVPHMTQSASKPSKTALEAPVTPVERSTVPSERLQQPAQAGPLSLEGIKKEIAGEPTETPPKLSPQGQITPPQTLPTKEGFLLPEKRLKVRTSKTEPSILESEKGQISIPSKEAVKGIAKTFYQKTVDRFFSIGDTVKKARELGADIPEGLDAGKRARGYLGIAGKVKAALENKTFKISKEGKIDITGEGLKPILDDFEKTSPEKSYDLRNQDLNEYLVSKRTIEDLQRPKSEWTEEQIVTPEQVKAAEATLDRIKNKYGDTKHLDDIADRLYKYQEKTLHLLVDSGVMSEEMFSSIMERNPHYIPFDRVLETENFSSAMPRAKKPFTEARSPVKKIKGSELEIHDPIESIIKNTYRIMDVAERNNVALGIARLKDIKELGIKEVDVPIVPKGKVKVEGETFQAWGKSPFKPKGDVIEYFENGQRKYIEVPKDLYEAMTGLNEASLNMLTKILSIPAHTLRVGATITPEFMVRNPLRDQWTAMIQTKFGFKPFVDPGNAIADILGKSDVYYDWLRSGGTYSTFTELSRSNLAKMVTELRNKKFSLKSLNIITHAQDISQLMEQATRLGAYKAAVKKGLSPVESGFQSREATVDFARRGSSMKDVNSAIAFFNAGIQGMDKTVRTFKNNPGPTTAKAIASITIPSAILYLVNKDDPKYKELPRWQKDMFWMIPTGSNSVPFARIPKPFVYGQVFGSAPERFFEYLNSKDPEAFNGLAQTLIDASTPVQGDPASVLLPTGIKPLIENATNWSFFRERPVVGEREKYLLPFQQYGKYTSETAKKIGKGFNYSPAKIENIIQGYFGGTGRYALEASDFLVGKATGEKAQKRPRELADYPLVKGFVTRPTESQPESLNRFYDKAGELSTAYKSYKSAIKSRNTEEAKYIRGKYPNLMVSPQIERYRDNISESNKEIEKIIHSNIPEETKRQRIRIEETKRLNYAKRANAIMERK